MAEQQKPRLIPQTFARRQKQQPSYKAFNYYLGPAKQTATTSALVKEIDRKQPAAQVAIRLGEKQTIHHLYAKAA